MAQFEFEISTIKGALIANTVVPKEVGEYPIDDSSFRVEDIIPGKINGEMSVKAVKISVGPPYSDGRIQRFPLNGRRYEAVSPEAENVLSGGNYKGRLRITK